MVAEILAVDPGLIAPACALFRDGVLVVAGPVKIPRALAKLDLIERCREVAKLIRVWYVSNSEDESVAADADLEGRHEEAGKIRRNATLHLVVERPQIYRASKSKGDPNDLPPMVGIDAALATLLDCPVTSYLPREWIGGTSKVETGDPWKSPRGARVWDRLSAEERGRVVDVTHDTVDSLGIGLRYLGRFTPRSVYPGAT